MAQKSKSVLSVLEALLPEVERLGDPKAIMEIEYRIYGIKTIYALKAALKTVDSRKEAKRHKDAVWRLIDTLVMAKYSSYAEGEDEIAYGELKVWCYNHLENPFHSISDVRGYRQRMETALNNFLAKWWAHRESIQHYMQGTKIKADSD